ncbi:amino acid ABC transporter permease [Nocardioides sp.]|uniref:amino acid ABC transporter permease n=1 Tax=Nocardioides sp. TaxID=35761 RepID=UPI0035AFB864
MGSDDILAVLAGIPMTLALTASALLIGAVGGIPLVVARTAPSGLVRLLARFLIEVLRGIPPLVWLFIIYFGVGLYLPWLSPLQASIAGLGVISCAYMAEIYRGALKAVHAGQWEASAALGMTRTTTAARIIGPQVIRISIPAAATWGIALIKDSSVAFTLGVSEILYWANYQARDTADPIWPFVAAAVVYIVMSAICAYLARVVDHRLRRRIAR